MNFLEHQRRFDLRGERQGHLEVRDSLPCSDVENTDEGERGRLLASGRPPEFGHTLEDRIGGQLDAGFRLTALCEGRHRGLRVADFMPTYAATRAVKP